MSRTLLALTLLAALAAWPAPASAGTYDVWSCAGPNWAPAPIAGWAPVSKGAPPPSDLCGSRQGLRAELQGVAAPVGSTTGWQFVAPAGMTIGSYELYRSARSGAAAANGGQRAFALYHDEPRFEPNVFLFEFCVRSPQACFAVGDPDSPSVSDPDNRVSRSGLRIKRLIVRMECSGGGDCPVADPPGGLTIGRARVGLTDDMAPVIDAVGGALVSPGAILDGPQGVRVSATDTGGGIERFDVVVDGAPVASHAVASTACRPPYYELVPCPTATDESFAFDTGAVPNGSHAIEVAAVDVGGNRTLSPAVTVTIANGATPNGTGASRTARLRASFVTPRGGRQRKRVRVPFGATRPVKGRLVDAHGEPIVGALLDVIATQESPGAQPAREGTVRTGRDGRFRYRPRRGPSRRLDVSYRAFSLDPSHSAVASVTLDVRAGVRLAVRPRRTSSRGTIHFHGRVLGGPGRAGVQVTLYAVGRRERSRVPVSVLTTDPSGRFRFRYQFVRTFAPFTYRFVARVERQRGYAYAPGSSPIATVRVVR